MPAAGGQGSAAQIPWGWLGYAEVTADQTPITAEVDLTSLTVLVTVGTSRRIKITGRALAADTNGLEVISLIVKEGATQLTTFRSGSTVSTIAHGLVAEVVLTPSAGAHTYKLAMARQSGTGTVTMIATATVPAFILVQDIGPAS